MVVARRDLANDELMRLAKATRDALGSGGRGARRDGPARPGRRRPIAVAVTRDLVERGVSAAEIAAPAAKLLGGGTAKNAESVMGGGPNADQVDRALELAARAGRRGTAAGPAAS